MKAHYYEINHFAGYVSFLESTMNIKRTQQTTVNLWILSQDIRVRILFLDFCLINETEPEES